MLLDRIDVSKSSGPDKLPVVEVGIQDALVFLICLMCWGGSLFLKGDRRQGGLTYSVLQNY